MISYAETPPTWTCGGCGHIPHGPVCLSNGQTIIGSDWACRCVGQPECDVVCQHGRAADVACPGCHRGFFQESSPDVEQALAWARDYDMEPEDATALHAMAERAAGTPAVQERGETCALCEGPVIDAPMYQACVIGRYYRPVCGACRGEIIPGGLALPLVEATWIEAANMAREKTVISRIRRFASRACLGRRQTRK